MTTNTEPKEDGDRIRVLLAGPDTLYFSPAVTRSSAAEVHSTFASLSSIGADIALSTVFGPCGSLATSRTGTAKPDDFSGRLRNTGNLVNKFRLCYSVRQAP